ncbi:MAG: NAD/NADP octopine/nopaline dehydrogenase family protein [Burkholderiales bacterium]|nr:NAD/NADP octopine/nopaline dehydrogenase family protein [Burkholderiales bacterium]
MDLAIAGGGLIGRATAALAHRRGHRVAIWSPSGQGWSARTASGAGLRLRYVGAAEGEAAVHPLPDPAALAACDTVLLAVPGNAYPSVLPRLLDGLRDGQLVVVSGALSLAPLWLYEQACARGIALTVASWGTTLCTARRSASADVEIGSIRGRFEMAAIPATGAPAAFERCRTLFGDLFNPVDSILATLLSNVNPVAHAAEVLPNLTRIECAEDWPLFRYLTPAAARIAEAIDAERIAIATAFGLKVRSVHEHTHLSYHVPLATYGEMAAAVHAKVGSPAGPTSFGHRYLVEDVPYGLAFFEAMGRVVAVPTPNISGTITVLSSACARDFRLDNPLLEALRVDGMLPAQLLARCRGEASPGHA